ncbi:MAG TPA: 4Fe-4S cluster-binding domain-containing protein, partial [Phenylobacterium sp.]|nr:4Fe-4S cluster-binding domain-containing protein [Phenylobacterium sp.]
MTAARTLRTPDDLIAAGLAPPERKAELEQVAARYAVAITPLMAELSQDADGPIARQFLPAAAELVQAPEERADPIGDDAYSPVEGVVHRYPDRVLLKANHACAVYCRFCFRREMVGPDGVRPLSGAQLDAAMAYIAAHPEIWEVILSGGDPLVLSPRRLGALVRRLDAIPHVRVIRVHTRVPAADPALVSDELVAA